MKAADFLAKSGDPKWFPQLLGVAEKNSKIGNYVYDAAESGGDQILPTLLSMLQSPDAEFTHPIAVSAFGYTGSRSAVPILLGLLRSSDTGDAQRALYGLRQLTHRDVGGDRWFDNPSRNILDGSTGGTAKAKLCPSVKQGNAAKSNPCDKSA